ncbi:MAG: hypothetical protein U0Q16_19240 [Bryobacteraceae bacterium]
MSSEISSSPGAFSADPAISQSPAGDTYVAVIDAGQVKVNVFDSRTRAWDTWTTTSGGATFAGTPAVAACNGFATLFARSTAGEIWTNQFTLGTGFTGWTNRGGSFSDDPVAARNANCVVYAAARTSAGVIHTGFIFFGWSGWTALPTVAGTTLGKPSIAVGADSAAYVVVRNTASRALMGRQYGTASFSGWHDGGGALLSDPRIASTGMGTLYVAALTSGGNPCFNAYTEGTAWGWVGSFSTLSKPLQDVEVAAGPGQMFLVGRSTTPGILWWYESPGVGWRQVTASSFPGRLAAAPR